MTERERQMIEAYLPNPRDPELGFDEYYVLDNRDRPVKVHIVNIGFSRYNEEICQVFTDRGRMVHGCWEAEPDMLGGSWYNRGALYDNKEDCRHNTHCAWDRWEELRELQEKEAMA